MRVLSQQIPEYRPDWGSVSQLQDRGWAELTDDLICKISTTTTTTSYRAKGEHF